jgi:hypothetical protein
LGETIVKAAMLLAGIAALLLGLLFAGQGLGYVPWPKSSFMIGEMFWAYCGLGIFAAGIVLIALARRRG